MSVPERNVPALVVAAYDPAWQQRGAGLAAELRVALGPLALRVKHIGSTAIPGMAAKPVFDLQVSVGDLDAAAAAFDGPLAAFGLTRRPYEQDHVPAGRSDPPHLWAKRLWTKPAAGGERIIVHCRLVGSPNESLALLFRDWFRAHPRAVPAYARFKEVLAAAVGDLEVYTDVKDPVVDPGGRRGRGMGHRQRLVCGGRAVGGRSRGTRPALLSHRRAARRGLTVGWDAAVAAGVAAWLRSGAHPVVAGDDREVRGG